jgi:hypothetical protein
MAKDKKTGIDFAKITRETKEAGRRAKSKFATESEAGSTMAVASLAPSILASLFIKQEETIDESKVERRNAPNMLKPGDVPMWTPENPVILVAEIIKVLDSPTSTIKGKLLWLRTKQGHEFTFPCTGQIRNALAPGVKDDDAKLRDTLEKEIGKIIYLKRVPGKMSKFNNEMFGFEVYTSKK